MENSSSNPILHFRSVVCLAVSMALLGFALGGPPTVAQEGTASDQEQESASQEEAAEPEAKKEPEAKMSFFGTETVTATGYKVDTFTVPAPVIVIDALRIEEILPDNAADLLRNEPGVDVNGIGPNQARPIIRGQRGLRVLFLQDGLRMNNTRRQTDFGEITGLVDVADVETLEVVRGAGSVLYGSDAIGGVLNLITKVPPSGAGRNIGGTVGLRYSTADEQSKIDASVSGHTDKFSYTLGGSLRDAEDYEAPSGSFGDITLDEDVVVNDSGVQDDTIHAYLGYRINDQQSIFFRGQRYAADETGFGFVDPDIIGESFLNRITYPFQDFERFTFGYSAAGLQSTAASTFDLRGYVQNNERDNGFFIDVNIGPLFPGAGADSSIVIDSLIFSDLDTFGFRGEATKPVGEKNLLTYGAEYYEDDSFNTRGSQTTFIARAVFPLDPGCVAVSATPPIIFECAFPDPFDTRPSAPNATNTGLGVFVQDSFYPTDRLSGTVGLRFARSETKAKSTPGWDISGLDFSDDDVVGSLSLVYSAHERVNLVASYATAFRAPNLIERLFNGPTPEGSGFQILNPDLQSENSRNIDFGLKYRGPNVFFEAVYFDTEIDDAIIQHTLSTDEIAALPQDVQDEIDQSGVGVVVQQRNAEVLKIDGVEIAIGYRFENGFGLGGNFTTLDGEAEVGGPAADPTGSTFSEKINGYLRYDRPSGRWWAEYRLRHNGEEDVVGALDTPLGSVLPSFTVHDLAGGVIVHESDRASHNLGLVVYNLTDELYAEFSNATFFRPQPKRNIVGSYRLRIK